MTEISRQKAVEALQMAVDVATSQSALAKRLEEETGQTVTQSMVWHWLRRSKMGVPAEYCAPIEKATGIPRHRLRPDIFEEPKRRGRRV